MNKDCIEIVAIRHGETEANKLGIIQGQTNTQLDAVGKAQAAAAAWRLRHEKFDLMLASDLDRAMDTAQAILQYHPGLPLQKEPLLREWNLGILQGKCADNMTAEEKNLFEALFSRGVEVRLVDQLWDLASAVQQSSLGWSLCRMKNALRK